MKILKLILVFVVLITLIPFLLGYILFPTDIQYYLPSFTLESWEKTHNSLLADPFFQFEPWRAYAKSRIISGELPLWNPYNGSGVPFLANPQVALFYPLNVLYYLLPSSIALNAIPFLKMLLMYAFTYLYLRSLKITKEVSLAGALLAVFAGFQVMWLLWPHTNVFLLLPLVLYLTEKLRTSIFLHKYYLFIALTYFVGVLGGHPETLFHIAVTHTIYSLFRLNNAKKWLVQMLFVCLGFLLSSFMLFPFLEYVLHSSLVSSRILSGNEYFLPIRGIVYNIFPQILGAPHLDYYKPLSTHVHFQELAGGYVGQFVIGLSLLIFLKLKKKKFTVGIFIAVILFYCIVYKIWPIYLVTKIPLISSLAHHRLIGFSGFFISILFSLLLNKFLVTKLGDLFYRKLSRAVILLTLLLLTGIPMLAYYMINKYPQYAKTFIPFFLNNISLSVISTSMLILMFLLFQKRGMKRLTVFVVFAGILLQPVLFFQNYTPFKKTETYYPKTELINQLQQLPSGNVLQVGNLNFPPNINLVYGLKNIQSDDAIGVASFHSEFTKTFDERNKFGIVDRIEPEDLRKFNISYVVSDYNLNYQLVSLNNESNLLIPINDNEIAFNIDGGDKILTGIRFLTANFNRSNSCNIKLHISAGSEAVHSSNVPCSTFRDNAFLTFEIPSLLMEPDKEYTLSLSSENSSISNRVALYGGEKPYVDLLFLSEPKYEKIWSEKNVYLFAVAKTSIITGVDSFHIDRNAPEYFASTISSDARATVEVKRIQYPGWSLYVDNVQVRPDKSLYFKFDANEGQHYIQLKYVPYSFIIGTLVSVITAISLLIYAIRNRVFSINYRIIYSTARKINGKQTLKVLIRGLVIALAIFFVLIQIPFSFKSSYSEGINWYTQNNFPRHKDQFYFLLAAFTFIAVPVSYYLYSIWKKAKRKKF